MFETYRMLGREREADLEREAKRIARAALASPRSRHEQRQRTGTNRRRITILVVVALTVCVVIAATSFGAGDGNSAPIGKLMIYAEQTSSSPVEGDRNRKPSARDMARDAQGSKLAITFRLAGS